MLAHINLVGRVHVNDIHDDDMQVIRQLLLDQKIRYSHTGNDTHLVGVNAKQYQPETEGPNAVAFFLATVNPSNEEYVKVFRKNWLVPELPVYLTEVDLTEVA